MTEIASPCVKLCVLHPESGYCVGCHRTMEEIAGWTRFSDAERAEIMATLPMREVEHKRRRGGRAAKHSRRSGADAQI